MSRIKNIGKLKPGAFSFKWEITNFCTSCRNVGDCLCSPVFQTILSNNIVNWQLELCPKGRKEEDKDYVSLFIRYCGETKVHSTIRLSILDCKNNEVNKMILFDKSFHNGKSWGYGRFIKRKFITEESIGILNNDVLSIFCELNFDSQAVLDNEQGIASDDNDAGEPDYRKELNDFEKLLETEHLSDVTFVIGENVINLHKAILASRSPVFYAMFEHEMKEKNESTVVITDIKYEVMKEVLRFIYASKVNDIQKYSSDILIAAEKYSILGLKELCEKNLCSNLNIQNALEYLMFASTCNAIQLKAQVIDFIVSQQHIVNNPEFKLLDPDVMCEVIRAIVQQNSPQ